MTAFDDDEAFAAEYVLGTLDSRERVAAALRRENDRAFDDLVTQWEQRLTPLAEAMPAVTPPPDMLGRVLAMLPQFNEPAASWAAAGNDNILIMRRQLRTWRRTAAAAAAIAAVMAVWIVNREAKLLTQPAQTFVAVLQHGADQPSFLVSLDLTSRRMLVRPLDTTAPPGKSYELWMIGGDQAPRSMGVVDSASSRRPALPNVDEATLSHATYAVTVEPLGGSPTGKPSSAPMFVGKLTDMAL